MKKALCFCLSIIVFSSCMNYKLETWFNKDGSGRSSMHLDMGEMMKSMKQTFSSTEPTEEEMIQDSLEIYNTSYDSTYVEEESIPTGFDSTVMVEEEMPIEYDSTIVEEEIAYEEDSSYYQEGESVYEIDSSQIKMQQAFKGLFKQQKFDTTINYYQLVVGSKLADTTEDSHLLKNVNFRIMGDSVKEQLVLDIDMKYSSDDEGKRLIKEFGRISEKTGKGAGSMRKHNVNHDVKNKTVYILEEVMEGEEMEALKGMGEEELKGVLEMMGVKELEMTYHLPGPIKDVKGIAYTKVDEDTIVVKVSMLDVLKTGKSPGYEIRYK